MADNFDIYALAGGYYPILGTMPAKWEEVNKDYGLGSSALNLPAYKTYANNATTTKYASIKGNYLSYGSTEENQLSSIPEAYEDDIFQALTSKTNPEKITKEAADVLDSDFKESLLKAQGDIRSGLLSEEGIKGRSMEEMWGAISTSDMMVGDLELDESGIAGRYGVKGISANPPDLVRQGKASDVSRQRLGKKGHSFWGQNLSDLKKDLTTIAENDKEGMYDTEFQKHDAMMQAGLKHFKARYTGLNIQIKRIKQEYLYSGRRPGTKLLKLGRQTHEATIGKRVQMGQILKDMSKTDAGHLSRSLASKNVKGQATNYLTDHAINLLKHHLHHTGPITEFYVLEPYVHAGYGPIMQYGAGTKKEFEYQVAKMQGELRYELFAGDADLKAEVVDFNAQSAAEARFGAHVSKELTGHGTVLESGKVYKQGVGLMKNSIKVRPSVGITQADKDFKDVIGKKLLPKLRQIATGMFVRQGRLFTGMLRDEVRDISDATGFDKMKDTPLRNAWATPYVSVFTFRRQAYGKTTA